MSDDYGELLAWLLKTFPDGAVVQWYVDNLIEAGAITHWADICIPGMEEEGFNWLWTIVGPDHETDPEDEDDPTVIVLDYDRDVHTVESFEGDEAVVDNRPVVSTPIYESPTEEQLWELYEHLGDRNIETEHAWSVNAIELALAEWCRVHLGRSYTFMLNNSPDLISPLARKALDALEAFENGDAPGYNLGDGIIASDELMNYLLSLDPDQAAELTAEIKEIWNGI